MLPEKPRDFNQERHLFLRTKDVDEANPNRIWAAVSTSEVDRYGEIVLPDGFKEALPAFVANPVVLPAHQNRLLDGSPPVIGNIEVETIQFTDVEVLMAVLFDDDELGQKYARKYRKKVMRAFSIGFRGLEGRYEELNGAKVWIWTKIELLEISAVAVPANPGALARVAGYYEHSDINDNIGEAIKAAVAEQFSELQKQVMDFRSLFEREVEDIKSILIPDSDRFADELLLGEQPDSSVPAGDNNNAEQSFERINNALNFGGKNNADQ